jgi:hypothetical protein
VALREGELWTRSFSFEGGKANEQNGLSAKMLAAHEAAPAAAPTPAAHEAPKPSAPAPVAAKPAPAPVQAAAPSTAPKAVEGAASGGAKPAPTAVASMAPAQKPKNVSARTLDAQQVFHPDPHLPEIVRVQRKGTGDARFVAKMCINNDGKVYQVNVLSSIPGADDAIVNVMKQWTYKPQPVSVCTVATIVFDLQ